MNERSIFLEALDRDDPTQRSAFLDTACAGDAALRQRVEELLQSHEEAGNFLDKLAPERVAEELAIRQTGDETQGDTPGADKGEEDLGFLTPSAKPDVLGHLSHYDVLEVIGRGGMGIVLRAFDDKLHRVVAIKVMAAQLATNATARKRFNREAQAAAAVSHDHLVTIHAVEEAEPLPYLVMQYVAGLSLQQRLDRDGPLELHEVLRIGMQTASGLAAAHAQGLTHRDVKPANILLENGVQRVKLTDFGLARAADDATLTQSGVVAGTPQYMSPEQAEGKAVDPRTDLFSLGSVLYALCTGRAPFRGGGALAVLKRVCEETPTPIRETNPGAPDWLVAIIDRLHAKDPAQRYQSAAEVAELLGRHLAQVQHPSVVGRASNIPPGPKAGSRPPTLRRLAVAAAVLVCVAAGLSLTEAAGVTNLRATVIRIFTPEGTLVVETDDPAVKVTVEGDGDLVITGAGPQEVRLRAGSYRLRATKDGQPVKLDRDLVAISRGDKQIVRVRLGEEVPAAAAPKAETSAFVVLGGQGVAERRFDTLAEAVLRSTGGDTIEVRGNGPFVTKPVVIRQALTIRAGEGFRPVIRLRPEGQSTADRLLSTQAALAVEGLEFQLLFDDERVPNPGPYPSVLQSSKALYAANCRFLTKKANVINAAGPVFEAWNCEFLCAVSGCSVEMPPAAESQRLVIDNCVLTESPVLSSIDCLARLRHNTFRTRMQPIWLYTDLARAARPKAAGGAGRVLRVESEGNVFDAGCVFLALSALPNGVGPRGDWESLLAKLAGWNGERNLFAPDVPLVALAPHDAGGQHYPGKGTESLAGWRRFWGTAEAHSIVGVVRYQGGDPLANVDVALARVSAEDFRLRADSAGYRAGPGGKDLGADVDLVGPGPAYKRWKKTPEYQRWLKETGQK